MMNQYSTYIARNGETWDEIAYEVYNDSFLYVRIMEANPSYADILTFNGGEVLQVPVNIETPETIITTPFKADSYITIVPSPWG